MVDNIIDIEGFEKYGSPLFSNIATYNGSFANIMNVHNNQTLMRYQGFFQEWNAIGGSTGSSIGFITGRAGGSSIALCIGDGSFNTTAAGKMLPANYSRTIIGFAFVNDLRNRSGISLSDTSANQLSLWVDNLGRVNLSRGDFNGTILYTSGALFLANAWHYIELDVTIHPTTGHYQIWVDGVSITNSNNLQNTRNGTNNYWNQFNIFSNGSICAFDDIYIRDNAAGTATPYGDCTIDRLAVTANSAVQFTPSMSILGTRYTQETVTLNAPGANQLVLIPVSPSANMTVNSIGTLPQTTVPFAKFKGVIYSDNAGAPGSLLSSGTEIVSCRASWTLSLPLVTPQALIINTQYWIGYITDTNINLQQSDNFSNVGQKKANTYTSDAPAGPLTGMTTTQPSWSFWGNCTGGDNYDSINKIPAPMIQGLPIAVNSSGTFGQKDLFLVNPMQAVPNAIYSLKVSVLASRSDTGIRWLNIHAQTGADGVGNHSYIIPGTSPQWYSTQFDNDPTGGSWGAGAINAVKVGYENSSVPPLLFNLIGLAGHAGFTGLLGPSGMHLYWRFNIISTTGGTYAGLSELTFAATAGGTSQAIGGTAISSSDYGGYPASNAFDGNTGSHWFAASGIGGWIGYHFSAPVQVAEVVANFSYGGPYCPSNVTIDYSDDGVTWTTAFATGNMEQWSGNKIFSNPAFV